MKTITRLTMAVICGFVFIHYSLANSTIPNNLTCTFSMIELACLEQHVKVKFTGNAPAGAIYDWDFDGAVVLEGSGQGPYWIKWLTVGEKHVSVVVIHEGDTCDHTRAILVVEEPALFQMTGGGSFPFGGAGVNVGLSGSEWDVVYKLRRNYEYTGINKIGTSGPIDFGKQTEPGVYDCVAKIDGSNCIREMEGEVTVTVIGGPVNQHICMVTFDTASMKNKIIWNKVESNVVDHFNIYRETYQNNHYEKIAEIPYSQFSVYVDTTADPLVKSDKYRISVTDTVGNEFDDSPAHKTIHLNINPGVYGFNLIWNHYMGFEFLTYRIHRKLGNNPWQVLDSVASNVDSYTDFYTTVGLVTYYIEVIRPEPCNPTKSNMYASVISNTVTAAPLGMEEDELSGIMLYPNPVRESLFLSVPGEGQELVTLEIYRPDGRKVFEDRISNGKHIIDVSAYRNGLYILKLKGNTASVVKKFFKD